MSCGHLQQQPARGAKRDGDRSKFGVRRREARRVREPRGRVLRDKREAGDRAVGGTDGADAEVAHGHVRVGAVADGLAVQLHQVAVAHDAQTAPNDKAKFGGEAFANVSR
jgi:hypothetical protein